MRIIWLALLALRARSWNRGDLDAFMNDYVDGASDSLIARRPTSLVLMRDAGQWRILEDHSS
jgi:hypothetical protein